MARESMTYLSTTKISSNVNFIFFKDDDLIINGIIKVNQSGNLESITLVPDSHKDSFVNFEIIEIQPCISHALGFEFYMIHFYVASGALDKEPFAANVATHLKGIKLKNANDKAIFLFNMHKSRPIDDVKCQFNTTQPKTKDGSIIVSI